MVQITNINRSAIIFLFTIIFLTGCITPNTSDLKSIQKDNGVNAFISPEENVNFYMQSRIKQDLNSVKKCFENRDVVREIYLISDKNIASFSYSIKSVTIYDEKSLKKLKKTEKFLFDFRNSPKKDDAGVIVSEKYIGDGEWRNFDFYYLLRKIGNNWLIINNVSLQDID